MHVQRLHLLLLAACAAAAGCSGGGGRSDTGAPCVPTCGARACGDDGCGGACGECPGGAACDAAGVCRAGTGVGVDATLAVEATVASAAAADCTRSCAELGLECGAHCGATCGTCAGPQDVCVDGRCVCEPACSSARCGQPDGCGAACGPCARDASCVDCALKLLVVERTALPDGGEQVTLAVDFAAPAGAVPPVVADLRIAVDGPATLERTALSRTVVDAHKELFVDPRTGHPYGVLPDGALRFLVFSSASAAPLPSGRWLFARFRLPAGARPTRFTLQRPPQLLAPPAANAALGPAGAFEPVVVWPGGADAR